MEIMAPMTAEAIKTTEKKMSMTLDQIIKMSKKSAFRAKQSRPWKRRSWLSPNSVAPREKSSKVQQFLYSRSSIRQELLSQRRLNSKGNGQYPVGEFGRRAAIAHIDDMVFTHNKNKYWNRTRPSFAPFQKKAIEDGVARKVNDASDLKATPNLDSLFANMKARRVRMISQHQMREAQPLKTMQARQRRGRVMRRVEAAPYTGFTQSRRVMRRVEAAPYTGFTQSRRVMRRVEAAPYTGFPQSRMLEAQPLRAIQGPRRGRGRGRGRGMIRMEAAAFTDKPK